MKPFIPHNLPLNDINWANLIPKISDANSAVARFDALLETIPNADLLLSPLSMNEAVQSSKIEGTQATLEEVFEFEANPQKDSGKSNDIQEVLNYRKAMRYAREELKKLPLSSRLIKEIHKILMAGVRGKNKSPGIYRKIPVFIGPPGAGIEDATFVPPESHLVPDCFSNLEKYMHFDEKDSIVQLAIIHAQFEIIHPFLDGNGRTGRIIMPLFLFSKEVISSPNFYLSEYFEKNRDEYYNKLDGISKKNDWENWIMFFLQAVIEQSLKNIELVNEINSLFKQKIDVIQNITHSQYTHKIADFIFSNPFFNSTQFRNYSEVPKPSAARILKSLSEKGVLEIIEYGRGRKPTVYVFKSLFNIIYH